MLREHTQRPRAEVSRLEAASVGERIASAEAQELVARFLNR